MNIKLLLLFLFAVSIQRAIGQAPDWDWAKSIGDTSTENVQNIEIDHLMNLYQGGIFRSKVDFDPGPDTSYLVADTTKYSFFISKSDQSGNLLWAKSFPVNLSLYYEYRIKLDNAGNVYAFGQFTDTVDFDPGPGVYNLVAEGYDVFILKLDSSGNLIWANRLGNSSITFSQAIALDTSYNIFISGEFKITLDFDPDPIDTFNMTANGISDIFISKYDSSFNFIFAKQLRCSGGNGVAWPEDVAIDESDGSILITGSFSDSLECDPDSSTEFYLTVPGSPIAGNIFLVKLDSAGNFRWAQSYGSKNINTEGGTGVVTDNSGFIYTTGYFYDTVDFKFGPGTLQKISNGSSDTFILKLDTAGNLIWVRTFGGASIDRPNEIEITDDRLLLCGYFWQTVDFDPTTGVDTHISLGQGDSYICSLDTSGAYYWTKTFGGSKYEMISSIALESIQQIYFSGNFSSDSLTLANSTYVNHDTTAANGISTEILFGRLASCSAYFLLYPDSTSPYHYYATNFARGENPLSYTWDWGDGTFDYTAYPSHVYADTGSYLICLTIVDTAGCSSTYCSSSGINEQMISINIVDDDITNVLEYDNKSVLLWPNPSTDYSVIQCTTEIKEINFYNLIGKNLWTMKPNSSRQIINTTDLPQGIYFLDVKLDDKSVLLKLLK